MVTHSEFSSTGRIALDYQSELTWRPPGKRYVGNKNKNTKGGKSRRLQNGKRRSTRAAATTVAGPVTNIGDRARTKLRFFHYGALSTASTGYAENIYRLNSCYDPDYSGAGAQPLGFDQWAAFYNRYKVLSAKWKVEFAAPTSLAESIVTVLPNLVNTIDNQGPYVMAEPYAKSSIFSTNGGWKPTMSDQMPIHKIFGITEEEFGEESYTAAVGGSPVNVAYLHVRVDTASGGLSGSVYYLTEIEYDVEFYSRVELELSLWSEFLRFKETKKKDDVKEISQSQPSQNPVVAPQEDKDVKILLARLLNK